VAPGWIATPLTQALRTIGAQPAILSRTPMARWGTPDEVAGGIVFWPRRALRHRRDPRVDGGYLTCDRRLLIPRRGRLW
jgi:NAD(P)-dependent dehydrogenase (short-subunit alcohol dehydrogenase family)